MTMTHGMELAITPVVAGGALLAMAFTPGEITALTVAAATLLGAIFSGVALIITTLRSTRARVEEVAVKVAEKVAENTTLTETIKTKVEVVEGKVDGTASRAEEQIKSLQKEIAWMRERLGDQKHDAAMLAQAKSSGTQVTVPVSTTSNVVNGVEKSLTNIDENTEAIKENTAKTEQKVNQLKDKL